MHAPNNHFYRAVIVNLQYSWANRDCSGFDNFFFSSFYLKKKNLFVCLTNKRGLYFNYNLLLKIDDWLARCAKRANKVTY